MLPDALDRVTAAQPGPSDAVLLGALGLAVALVALPATWPVTRHVLTVAHEGGHGVAALLTGRRLDGIRLHSDTSGLTVSRGRPRGAGMVLTLLAGHLGPAALGLLGAAVLSTGRPLLLLWVLLIALAGLLLQIRNLFGLWVVLVCSVATAALTWAAPQLQTLAAHVLTWVLLLGAPRTVLELGRARRRRGGGGSDADQLAALTRVPAVSWVLVLGLATAAAAVLGGVWLGVDDPVRAWLGR